MLQLQVDFETSEEDNFPPSIQRKSERKISTNHASILDKQANSSDAQHAERTRMLMNLKRRLHSIDKRLPRLDHQFKTNLELIENRMQRMDSRNKQLSQLMQNLRCQFLEDIEILEGILRKEGKINGCSKIKNGKSQQLVCSLKNIKDCPEGQKKKNKNKQKYLAKHTQHNGRKCRLSAQSPVPVDGKIKTNISPSCKLVPPSIKCSFRLVSASPSLRLLSPPLKSSGSKFKPRFSQA